MNEWCLKSIDRQTERKTILFDVLFIVDDDDDEEVFVAVFGTVDDRRVAVAGNVELFVWRVAWGNGREFFDDWDCELLFDRLTVYWLGWGGLVGVDRLVEI